MTITEFLLARIAEDEALAHRAQRGYQHVFGIPHWFTANHDTSVAMTPRTALADCQAKRRIVEHVEPDALTLSPGDDYVLQLLALPYADHPDFDEAWRV